MLAVDPASPWGAHGALLAPIQLLWEREELLMRSQLCRILTCGVAARRARTLVVSVFLATGLGIPAAHAQGFDYFGLPGPGEEMRLFAPGRVSVQDSTEKSLAISPDGREVFFKGGGSWPQSRLMHMTKAEGQWSDPALAAFVGDGHATEPAFSPDGKSLYYSSSQGEEDIKQYSIWRVRKVEGAWSAPEKVIDIEEPDIMEFHPTVTRRGDVYFCYWDYAKQKGSLYKAARNGDSFLAPVKVEIPEDATASDVDPFVDSDESYIIFGSRRRGGLGGTDVYISYRKGDTWTAAINLGERFNTAERDNSIDISPDGRYAFFYRQGDVYWMEARRLFETIAQPGE
jgi:hypothetical protein